jgi:hypothetical protein
MADPYKVTHIKLLSATDTATLQTWLDTNYPIVLIEVLPVGTVGLDLLIVYS